MADAAVSGGMGLGTLNAQNLRTPINLVGAVLSISLVVGLSIWGYQLAVRDVSGVPVVRALEGPMRVRPEEPGGEPANFQGLSVNQVPAEGFAAPAPDRLILAPDPVEITEDDVVAPDPLPTASANDLAVAAALADINLTDVETTAAPVATPAPALIDVISTAIPGVKTSPWPLRRPRAIEAAVAARAPQQQDAAATAAVVDVAADSIAPGTRLVQLGAFDSIEEAQAEWALYAAPFAEYFDGRQRVIQEASSGGRTFYRLRVHGFTDIADARRFCSVLLAKDAPCIPVVAR